MEVDCWGRCSVLESKIMARRGKRHEMKSSGCNQITLLSGVDGRQTSVLQPTFLDLLDAFGPRRRYLRYRRVGACPASAMENGSELVRRESAQVP